eukprot:Phypoly_transcript_16653.p1 GENE.Phypoly_transcript_16653~~Phypoly_transcript_16653.p1  ORF type:complete len:251 (+),score=41.48 Phypoly_transcript_16653:38-790(+)
MSMLGNNGRVVLNVGGKRFETLIDTLQKYPDTMLGAMFSARGLPLAFPDDNGEYFFDRDPKLFDIILNFYRHGKVLVPENRSYEMVKEELDFFGIVERSTLDTPIGIELKREADIITQKKITGFLEDFLVSRMKSQASSGHYSFEVGFVPERHSMNNMTNLPTLPKNSDYYELFSERENRKKVTKLLKSLQINSKWDRSEQVNIATKEFLFECFKLTVWWNEDTPMEIQTSEMSSMPAFPPKMMRGTAAH